MRISIAFVIVSVLLFPKTSLRQSASDLYCKAKIFQLQNLDLRQGLKYINRCIRNYPSDSAYLLRASLETALGDHGAEKDYKRALALTYTRKDSANIFYALGNTLIYSDSLRAFKDFAEAYKLDSTIDYNNGIGDILLSTKHYNMAVDYYTRNIALWTDSSISSFYPYSGRAIAKYRSNDFTGALADFDLSLHYDPNCRRCCEFKVKTLEKLNRLNEACTDYDKIKGLLGEDSKTTILVKDYCKK